MEGDDLKSNTEFNSLEQGKDLNFCPSPVSDNGLPWSKSKIINGLMEVQHTTYSILRKNCGWKHASLYGFIRELEIIRLIRTELIKDENGRKQKIIHYIGGSK